MKNISSRLFNWWSILAITAVFGILYMTVLHPWMNRWGMSDSDLNMTLEVDTAVSGQVITSTRGITINAPAAEVWKWVVQLGQERAGFYSNDWLENLVLADIHNSNEIHPEWQSRQQGDRVNGAGGAVYGQSSFWPVLMYEPGKIIFLWGGISVLPLDSQTSRIVTRTYAAPASPAAQVVSAFSYDWMHFVMERGMLLGIEARAEKTSGSRDILQGLAALGWVLATFEIGLVLFMRRRNWWWGLLALAYAAAILFFTGDGWASAAGFLWFGIITAGFLVWGSRWWKGLVVSIMAVITIFVLSNDPHTVFGLFFLALSLLAVMIGLTRQSGLKAAPFPAKHISPIQ